MRQSLFAIALILAGCAAQPGPRVEAPDAALTETLTRWDQEDPADLRGVIVLRDGVVAAERYYGGATASDLQDVRSAGKSVTGLLMAIAVDRGLVTGFDAPVARYWSEAADKPVGRAAIGDLLSMRSGLAADDDNPASPGLEDYLDEVADPHRFILGLPADGAPGQAYRYNSVTASVAGIVVARAAGRPMSEFAREVLFEPLGIRDWRWDADRAGYTKGQGNLRLRLRDFAALGEMVRLGGVYQGRRIVSRARLDDLLAPQVRIADVDSYADTYGGFWYRKTYAVGGRSVTVRFASGNGGNKVYVIPERRMVIAITSAAYGRGYGQRRSEAILLALLAASATDPR
jgi:CubicO group peptidase (beta-lactamase class C family)